MKKSEKIAVIGGGSWATALVKILSDSHQHSVYWHLRNQDDVFYVQKHKHNPKYLRSVELHIPAENISNDLKWVVQQADIIILVVPAAFLKESVKSLTKELLKGKIIVSAIKGFEPSTNLVVSDFLKEFYDVPLSSIAAITGPCHAEEVALERLSYLTIASSDTDTALRVAHCLENDFIKTCVSNDIYGTEYAAILKNIFALACGICHGLNYGDNFLAVLASNSVKEMVAFARAVNPIERDINDSAYLGDLLVTAYSQFSRNRTFGTMIGKGYSVLSAQMEMNMIAEGYYASKCLHEVNKKYKVHLPICEAVYGILYENQNPQETIERLSHKLK